MPRVLTDPAAIAAARKVRQVVIAEDGAVILLRTPTLAELNRFTDLGQGAGLSGLAACLVGLIVDAGGVPVFQTADQLAETLSVEQIEAVAAELGKAAAGGAKAARRARKNSPATPPASSSSGSH
jgi:hypothetical protein